MEVQKSFKIIDNGGGGGSFKKYIKKSVGTGILNVAGSAIFSACFIPLLVHKLGLELYGKWMLIFLFSGFASILDLGISKSMVCLLPKSEEQKEKNSVYSAGLIFCALIVTSVLIISAIVYCLQLNVWGSKGGLSWSDGKLLYVFASLLVCLSLLTNFFRSILESFLHIYLVNIGFLLLTILNYTSVYALSFFSTSLDHIIYCSFFVYVTILAFHLLAVKITCNIKLILPNLRTCRTVAKTSIKFMSVGLLIAIVTPLNRYLLMLFSGDTKIYGIFDIALKLAMMANSMLALFATPLLSVFSKLNYNRLNEIKIIVKRSLLWLLGGYFAGILLFALIGSEIVAFIVKEDCAQLYVVTLILMSGICLSGVTEPCYRAFLGLGDLRPPLIIKMSMVCINLCFIMLASNLEPLIRVAIAISLAYGLSSLMLPVAFKIRYKMESGGTKCS